MKRKLMLYDEPTSGQDGENLLRTAELIRAANKQAASTLIVTHDPDVARQCDRTFLLADGSLTPCAL